MQISMHQGSTRYSTRSASQVTHHSFSFGDHYDPDNLSFGPMRAHNEHRLSWGAGFPEHRHSDVELVTWVMHGQVVHTDSLGNRTLLPAGTVQVQSAGSGISHSEFADTTAAPTRFVQTWLTPDEIGVPPARFLASGMQSERMTPVAGVGAQVPVGCSGATLFVGSLDPGTEHDLPVCSSHHLFVASGQVVWSSPDHENLTLGEGDALRITDADDAEMQLRVLEQAEVMQWVFRTPQPE